MAEIGLAGRQADEGLAVLRGSVQLAISNWEAVRGYMEYELNDLSALQDPLGLQEPGDPPHEGLHTFRNARAGLHRRLREKEVGRIYAFFWYVYHVMTLWTLPNRLVEWEIKRIAKVGRRALPQPRQPNRPDAQQINPYPASQSTLLHQAQ